jgi:hypothetical protein
MTAVDRRHAIGQRHPGFNLTDQPYRPAAELPWRRFLQNGLLEKMCLLKKCLAAASSRDARFADGWIIRSSGKGRADGA